MAQNSIASLNGIDVYSILLGMYRSENFANFLKGREYILDDYLIYFSYKNLLEMES